MSDIHISFGYYSIIALPAVINTKRTSARPSPPRLNLLSAVGMLDVLATLIVTFNWYLVNVAPDNILLQLRYPMFLLIIDDVMLLLDIEGRQYSGLGVGSGTSCVLPFPVQCMSDINTNLFASEHEPIKCIRIFVILLPYIFLCSTSLPIFIWAHKTADVCSLLWK